MTVTADNVSARTSDVSAPVGTRFMMRMRKRPLAATKYGGAAPVILSEAKDLVASRDSAGFFVAPLLRMTYDAALASTWFILCACLALFLCPAARAGEAELDARKIDDLITAQIAKDKLPSLSIGVVRDQELVLAKSHGTADRANSRPATPDSLYYIGSVTKVLTTTLTCILRDQGVVGLDDPVSKYLPDTVKLPVDPRGAPAITLRHLATHASGLPQMPPNLTPREKDMWGGYTVEQLYAGLPKVTLASPIGAEWRYSNLGMGLLGHVLERATGESYEQLLKKRLSGPLGMQNTTVTLSPEQKRMLTTGYGGDDLTEPVPDWAVDCLVGNGGVASSVNDMARFLSLQFRAGQAGVRPVSGGTLTELHTPQRLVSGWDQAIGLGWLITPVPNIGDVVWHNGEVTAHHAFIGFSQKHKTGVVVLTNAAKDIDAIGFLLLAAHANASTRPATQPTGLPSGAEIVDKHVAATGQAVARARIRNMVVRGKMDLEGFAIDFESYNAAPARFYLRAYKGPLVIGENGVEDGVVWQRSLGGAATVVVGEERESALREARLHGDVDWRKSYRSARCVGVSDFAGRRCYKVEMVPISGPGETRYYDVSTHLCAGAEETVETQDHEKQTTREVYEDYRPFDGVLYACTTISEDEDGTTRLTIESVQHNAQIPEDKFKLPPNIRKP